MKKSFVKTVATLAIGMMIGSATMAVASPTTVQAVLSKFNITVDGKEQKLKSDPLVYNGTTYLPVREVAGMLNAEVTSFDNKAKIIELKTNEAQQQSTTQFEPIKPAQPETLNLKLNETATKGDMTLKVSSVSYADFIPYEPGASAGTYPEPGYKFAVINFDVQINAEPKDKFDWWPIEFFESAIINGKTIHRSSSFVPNNVRSGEIKSVQIAVSVPSDLMISSITFRNPSNNTSFGTIDL
ncbi:stalk domain-containing protein [Paenibacillus solani]|uniref:stalk domain-containing protein n=1 Tax=Paenibacillus solani TaxID=1705565 RepID=UPI003D26E943